MFASAYGQSFPGKHLPGWNKIASFFGEWKRHEWENGNGHGEQQQPKYKLIRTHENCSNCKGGWLETPDGMERCSECWQRVEVQVVQS